MFEYTALDEVGKNISGYVEADSKKDAIRIIREKGQHPTVVFEIHDADGKAKNASSASPPPTQAFKRLIVKMPSVHMSSSEKVLMIRELVVLLGSGMPLLRTINVLAKSSTNRDLRIVLHQISLTIKSGSTFSEALSRHPSVFDSVFVNMVRAGEAGGVLEVALERIADYIENSEKTKYIIRSAWLSIIYLFILVVIFAMGSLAFCGIGLSTILTFRSVFSLAVLAIVSAFLAIMSVFIVLCRMYPKTWDRIKFKLPVIGKLYLYQSVVSLCRVIGTLLGTGCPVLQTLNIARDTCYNSVFVDIAQDVHDRIKAGKDMASALDSSSIFPKTIVEMVKIGEHSEALSDILNKAANLYEKGTCSVVGRINRIAMVAIDIALMILLLILVSLV